MNLFLEYKLVQSAGSFIWSPSLISILDLSVNFTFPSHSLSEIIGLSTKRASWIYKHINEKNVKVPLFASYYFI